jgi:hypothetical protein
MSANFLKINPGTVQFAVKLKNKYMEEPAPSISDYQASHQILFLKKLCLFVGFMVYLTLQT